MALRPGDRIRLIREIVAALKDSDHEDIELVLRQHHFPAGSWTGHISRSYVQEMIEGGDDDALRELHSFLYSDSDGQNQQVAAQSEAAIWTPRILQGDRFLRLFISHTHHHKAAIAALKAALISHGVSAFVAHQDIEPTAEWADVIEIALRSCDALLAYLTDEFPASRWSDQEVGAAVGRDVLVVPLKVSIDPYGLIGRYQAIRGGGLEPTALAGQVVTTLSTNSRTRQLMAEVTVDRLYHSYSYNNARDNLKRIERIPRELWTPHMIARARQAATANGEVRDANVGFGVSTVAAEVTRLVDSL
jgi:TIR domain